MTSRPHHNVELPEVKTAEFGAPVNDEPQELDKRLYVQFHAFGGCSNPKIIKTALQNFQIHAVVYLDVNDPAGIGIAFFSQDPVLFTSVIRDFLTSSTFKGIHLKPEYSMFGRTYSSGREKDLEDWLLTKPLRSALNPKFPWAIWYPLRRRPEFETLTPQEQGKILMEHSLFGRAYAERGLAHDIRLACHGLDKNDNDFIIGITGPELHVLSKLVQNMRKTQQTSKYLESLGPFFVGNVFYQSPAPVSQGGKYAPST